jgi:hypothetical protein
LPAGRAGRRQARGLRSRSGDHESADDHHQEAHHHKAEPPLVRVADRLAVVAGSSATEEAETAGDDRQDDEPQDAVPSETRAIVTS